MAPGRSLHEIALTAGESTDNLSALSKHTYGKLFAWIVGFVNRCHNRHVHDLHSNGSSSNNNGGTNIATGEQREGGAQKGGKGASARARACLPACLRAGTSGVRFFFFFSFYVVPAGGMY